MGFRKDLQLNYFIELLPSRKVTMPTILDLSNEILHGIIQAIPRNDLLFLSLTSKWLHALCDGALKRQKKYSTVSFGNYGGGMYRTPRKYNPEVHEDARDAMLLLEDIIRDPEIVSYPEIMCLGCCVDVEDDRLQVESVDDDEMELCRKRQSVITHRSSELKNMIDDCDFILEEEKETSFAALCNPENKGVAVGLALTMLPNLKRIATQAWWRTYSSDRIGLMIARIAEANQNSHSPFHNKALTGLEEFFMGARGAEGGQCVWLFIPFAMLPSMRYLGGNEICDDDNYLPRFDFRSGSSLVTEINFSHSAISAEGFDELLLGISALRKFTYHHDDWINCDCQYEPSGIVRLLRKYAASSLQHLDITANFDFERPDDTERQQCVGSLQKFTALEVIRLEDVAFQDPSLDSDSNEESSKVAWFDTWEEDDAQEEDDARKEADVEDESNALEEDNPEEEDGADQVDDVENEKPPEQSKMNRLVDFLPVSVQSFSLVQVVGDPRRQELLCGLLEERSEKLPHLRTLMFEGNDPVDNATKAALERAGLIVEIRAKPSIFS